MPPSETRPIDRVLVIGPATAGKTCYLGTLEPAADRSQMSARGWRCKVQRPNEQFMKLAQDVRQAIVRGSFDHKINATEGVNCYEFEFVVERSSSKSERSSGGWRSFLRLGGAQPAAPTRAISRYRILDGAGGLLLALHETLDDDHDDKTESRKFRRQLIEEGRRSQGLVLCVDAGNRELAALLFQSLPTLLHEWSDPVLPFRRVVVLLTKAEMVVADARRKAKREIEEQRSAWQHTRRMFGPVLGSLFGALSESATLAFGWCSAYGFIPGEGSPNFDPKTLGLRSFDPNVPLEACLTWEPFRVLDPLIFMATGDPCNLDVGTADQWRLRLAEER